VRLQALTYLDVLDVELVNQVVHRLAHDISSAHDFILAPRRALTQNSAGHPSVRSIFMVGRSHEPGPTDRPTDAGNDLRCSGCEQPARPGARASGRHGVRRTLRPHSRAPNTDRKSVV